MAKNHPPFLLVVFRPSDRRWYLLGSASGFSAAQCSLSLDKIVPAEYDGDGKADIAVFRDGAEIGYDLASCSHSTHYAAN